LRTGNFTVECPCPEPFRISYVTVPSILNSNRSLHYRTTSHTFITFLPHFPFHCPINSDYSKLPARNVERFPTHRSQLRGRKRSPATTIVLHWSSDGYLDSSRSSASRLKIRAVSCSQRDSIIVHKDADQIFSSRSAKFKKVSFVDDGQNSYVSDARSLQTRQTPTKWRLSYPDTSTPIIALHRPAITSQYLEHVFSQDKLRSALQALFQLYVSLSCQ